ncbi:dihydrolipoyllysine-residue acetyltransferase [Marinobacter nanhaiticus D15-8W]|uniref:Dihydrolipoamide acetyltransferase component of pyruvate dehydrogenase complex n=1 Tax=Marinobacter nanhaiticus D15-8W TaxID=626887 RepID=N6X120_9GAMM|nr:dihydrolipoyllysine-residue acetyltransferase [Marinobacter nanhaiticus]ENO14753.1 dihydrolipoyllysine-residue acetyltransferase [Marinobacter nanhaiticus D15-8W]BES69559.1 dihydrolipoyllysine-residue acetyltransferase [Marinobacter nanhaiticus D15-8W]
MSDFILPDIGEGIVECELVKWLVSEGDIIEEDQPVAEVMTDKALVEIPAPYKGRVARLYHQEGDIAKVHEPLFELIAEEDEDSGDSASAKTPSTAESYTKNVQEAEQKGQTAVSDDGETEDFILPDIGEGIVECEVVEWRIAEGDEIEEDQPVVDVMTDKAMVEITAPKAGRVSKLYYQKEEQAKVHSPLFAFVPREREEDSAPAKAQQQAEPKSSESVPATAKSTTSPQTRQRIPASPAVRRLVREHDLELADIAGTGKDGRVLKADILAHLEKPAAAKDTSQASELARTSKPRRADTGDQEVRVEPIKGMRAAMAKRMAESASTIPHFNFSEDIDVTDLLALREKLKPEAETRGTRLTLMPFIMKAMALAVQEFPILNSRLNDEVTEIHYQPNCNIGMAVDSKVGLIVPNVKGVERLSLLEIADEVARLTEDARNGRVSQEDLKGGTITISNIGALAGTYAAPIINPPEVAIVALGRTQRLPRFDEHGEVVARSIMTISWAGDHRIIDGGTIARFSNRWKGYLEAPQTMLLHLG